MAIKVKVKLQGMRQLQRKIVSFQKPMDKKTAEKIGKFVKNGMLALISKGRSPIQGKGAFRRYKNPKRYPGKRKPHRPVNLQLTGDFLSDLQFKLKRITRGNWQVLIGYFTKESRLKEIGHREGANGQPKRPTIPQGDEDFHRKIKGGIIKLMDERLRRLIRK